MTDYVQRASEHPAKRIVGRVTENSGTFEEGDPADVTFRKDGLPRFGREEVDFHRVKSDGSTIAWVVKDAPGFFYGADMFTSNSNQAWLRVYDKASAPDPSSDVPIWDGMVPGLTGGAGFCKTLDAPKRCVNGIAFVLVSGAADDDETAPAAGDFTGSIQFR